MYNLFDTFARRYDWHTPPDHYFRDHELVISLAAEYGPDARLLDVGCGTGVLISKAIAAGIQASGFDASADMVEVARGRIKKDAVWVQRMQELDQRDCYDLVVSLSWCVHYCADRNELQDVVERMYRSLRPGGRLLLQVAHADNLSNEWLEDREMGPAGLPDDVVLRFRFRTAPGRSDVMLADYGFVCHSLGEAFSETHELNVANAIEIADMLHVSRYDDVQIWDSWKRDPFASSGNVFVTGLRRP
ncbi:class I SAM-dependent DNA methyltransferase [Paraburkholderia azotifigens]|uniref:Class I SAM-dependent methyltransferase n=1 Tax=Paraburkholderia azotifigens TaxID=2057004 RepID=A0A5C6V3H5_9BURK|nr:class I SAM-dependent methyltransferase [Paraburkholderia azotifigens]TXC79106.1 class I SAM-dependent methyltransferase [Paraburkholderia azotifigens]